MWIRLGNPSPREGYRETPDAEDMSYRDLAGPTVTTLMPPDGMPLPELYTTITIVPRGIWFEHARLGSAPEWVASDDADTQAGLALLLGCAAGEPVGYLAADSANAAADKDMPGLDHTEVIA